MKVKRYECGHTDELDCINCPYYDDSPSYPYCLLEDEELEWEEDWEE